MKSISSAIALLVAPALLLPTAATAQTLETWDQALLGPEITAKIKGNGETRIQVKTPVAVQGIDISGQGEILIEGESITLGAGCDGGFNSLIVHSGEVTINSNLISTQNKRIALGKGAQSLTLNGDIETGDQTTQIGNLGNGVLTINGNRSGGNSLYIRDGTVVVNGILSGRGGGNTVVRDNGVLVSSRDKGPTFQPGSFGLVLLDTGVFRLAAANQIASFVNFAGGKLEMNGFSNDTPVIGNVRVTGNSVIDFSNAEGESLAIADVSGNTEWKPEATLQIVGFSQGDSLRFGNNGTSLTKEQLAMIKFDGKPAQIDADGYVTPTP